MFFFSSVLLAVVAVHQQPRRMDLRERAVPVHASVRRDGRVRLTDYSVFVRGDSARGVVQVRHHSHAIHKLVLRRCAMVLNSVKNAPSPKFD